MNRRYAPFLVLALTVAACGGEETARTTIGQDAERSGGLRAELQAPIDSGNVAFRARDYDAALRHYREATVRAPEEPTGWFGVVMAADALGDSALADSARARIVQIAPELNPTSHTPDGHPDTALEGGAPGMPAGHPTTNGDARPDLPVGHP
jgi:hypothetical protein